VPVLPARPTPGNPIPAEWGIQVVDYLEDHEARILANTLIGEMKIWPSDTVPNPAYLFCRGQSISRLTYPLLFAVVGTKWGAVDGNSFNLPNMQGMVPVGLNTGTADGIVAGAFTGALGTAGKIGTPNAILPTHVHGGGWHSHGVNIWSGGEDVDHAHYVNMNTSDVSNLHTHATNIPVYYWQDGTGWEWGVRHGDGSQIPMSRNQVGTTADGYHVHAVSGWSGGRNTGHRHAINGYADANWFGSTDERGQSPINGNIQPSLYVNYIIKAA
jgi:microcystin-dependent protein